MFVAPPLEDCLTGQTGSSTQLELVVQVIRVSVALLPTAKHLTCMYKRGNAYNLHNNLHTFISFLNTSCLSEWNLHFEFGILNSGSQYHTDNMKIWFDNFRGFRGIFDAIF